MASAAGTKLMALCTLAVSALYAAGYVYTEPGAHASLAPRTAAGSPTTTPAPTRAAVYRDGTYTGSGANLYGTLTVAVRVAGGKIASVQITSYSMHYPQYLIDPTLNQEVVAQQRAQVYVVTGVTASSDNFIQAVAAALAKART